MNILELDSLNTMLGKAVLATGGQEWLRRKTLLGHLLVHT